MLNQRSTNEALESRPTVESDICLILEGTYPYVMGGVSGWTHALLNSMSEKTIAISAIFPGDAELELEYELPDNVSELHTAFLNQQRPGKSTSAKSGAIIDQFHQLMQNVILDGSVKAFMDARNLVEDSNLSQSALLDSKQAWLAISKCYDRIVPTVSFLQFFWTWRTLVSGVLVCSFCEIPKAKMYHAISTGYAGLIGARASIETGRPYLITEHGIYTNERRIELNVADWLYETGHSGYSVTSNVRELRDLWMSAFSSFARIAYEQADVITTLYQGNQEFQMADGASPDKLMIIPNGVDVEALSASPPIAPESETRPTIGLIGRVVPIKDIRMFISACAYVKESIPNVRVLILGPENEDKAYAKECFRLVEQLGLSETIQFCGRVTITDYLPMVDVLVLTSLSEAQPLVLLEAGAAGIPSVATDVGSCREILEGFAGDLVEGKGGTIVACGDDRAAGEAMIDILNDDEMRAEMGAVMRLRVEQTYNKTLIDERYRTLFDHWIQESQNRPAPQERLQ